MTTTIATAIMGIPGSSLAEGVRKSGNIWPKSVASIVARFTLDRNVRSIWHLYRCLNAPYVSVQSSNVRNHGSDASTRVGQLDFELQDLDFVPPALLLGLDLEVSLARSSLSDLPPLCSVLFPLCFPRGVLS